MCGKTTASARHLAPGAGTVLVGVLLVAALVPSFAGAMILRAGTAPGNVAIGFSDLQPRDSGGVIDYTSIGAAEGLEEVQIYSSFTGQTVSQVPGPGGPPGDGGPFRRLEGSPNVPFAMQEQPGSFNNLQVLNSSGFTPPSPDRLVIGLLGMAFLGTGSVVFDLDKPTDMFGAFMYGYNYPIDGSSNGFIGEAFFDFYDEQGAWIATLTGTLNPDPSGGACRQSFSNADERYTNPNPGECGNNNRNGEIWFETEPGDPLIGAVVFSHNDFRGLGLGGLRVTRTAPILPTTLLIIPGLLLLGFARSKTWSGPQRAVASAATH